MAATYGSAPPARRCHDLEWECRGHQNPGKQVVWVERDRHRQECIKLFRVERLASGRLSDRSRKRVSLRQYVKGKGCIEDQAARQNPREADNDVPSDVSSPHDP